MIRHYSLRHGTAREFCVLFLWAFLGFGTTSSPLLPSACCAQENFASFVVLAAFEHFFIGRHTVVHDHLQGGGEINCQQFFRATMIPSMTTNAIIFTAAAAILLIATDPTCVECFSPSPAFGRSITDTIYARRPFATHFLLHIENPNKGSSEEEIVGEQYEGTVDWDAEWQKVVQNRDQPTQRPGSYKSPVEIAAIKATNKVAKNVFDASQDMKSSMPSVPSIQSLQGDWRFWIGIIVIVSFGLSILTATSSTPVNDSFYI